MRISDWSSDVCSSDLPAAGGEPGRREIVPAIGSRSRYIADPATGRLCQGRRRAGGRCLGRAHRLMLLAILIFVATIALVIWQPKGLGIGWSAMGGAIVALLAGVISLSDIPVVWNIIWNATGAFVAIILISLILDRAGFFEWAALHVPRSSDGRRVGKACVRKGRSRGSP